MSSYENEIRRWIVSLPGLITAPTPSEVVRKAWASSGVECSVGDFADTIWRAGFRPEQVGVRWQLAFPERGVLPHDNSGALRKLGGER